VVEDDVIVQFGHTEPAVVDGSSGI